MKEMILAYQGEMTLKGLNRNKFEARLAKSIRYRLEDLGPFQVTQAQSTVFIEPRADGLDMDEMILVPPGIQNFRHRQDEPRRLLRQGF